MEKSIETASKHQFIAFTIIDTLVPNSDVLSYSFCLPHHISLHQERMIENLIEHLGILEYAIRQSMTVREDQDEPADPQHLAKAGQYGIAVDTDMTKGDLLNAVQTMHRACQKQAITSGKT